MTKPFVIPKKLVWEAFQRVKLGPMAEVLE